MDDALIKVCYAAFIISTTVFLRRADYPWVAAILAGLVSPVAFLVFNSLLMIPAIFLVVHLHVPDRLLPQHVLEALVALATVAGWCIGGHLLSRRRPTPPPPAPPQLPG